MIYQYCDKIWNSSITIAWMFSSLCYQTSFRYHFLNFLFPGLPFSIMFCSCLRSYLFQICKCHSNGFKISHAYIFFSMFFKKLFDPWIHLRKPELRTLREQMMLDLKVEIRHPPVGEKMTFDIHGVFAWVFRPSQLKIGKYFCFMMESNKFTRNESKYILYSCVTYIAIFVSYVQMSMTNSKINENFCCCYLSGCKIHNPGKSKTPSHDIAGENRKPTNPSN